MVFDAGEIVKKCRKKIGWSQDELALEMNLTQSTVSRLEKNKVTCDVSTLMRIAERTNAQDVAMSMLFNIDISVVTQMLQLLPTFAGGILLWML